MAETVTCAVWELHLKDLLLADTLCVSTYRTFSAAVSAVSSFLTKLCHLSYSVDTSVVFSQVRNSNFSGKPLILIKFAEVLLQLFMLYRVYNYKTGKCCIWPTCMLDKITFNKLL